MKMSLLTSKLYPAPKSGYSALKITEKRKPENQPKTTRILHYRYKDGKYITPDHIPGEKAGLSPTSVTSNTIISSDAATGKPVDAPTIMVGDSYTFEVENSSDSKLSYTATREVAAIDENRMTIVTTNAKSTRKRTTYYDRTWSYLGSGTSDKDGVSFSPALKYLDFPLSVGKKWTSQSIETNKKSGQQRLHTISGTVEGWEKVQVPAGDFDALKIVLKTEVKDGDVVSPGSDISWYVPALRRSVKSEMFGIDVSTGREEKK